MSYLETLPAFLTYFGAALVLLAVFKTAYVWTTPYKEIALIREGNVSAVSSLLGAMLGFSLPLASAIAHSVSLMDMLVWSLVALVVQVVTYRVSCMLIPEARNGIPEGNVAHGLMIGGISVVVGLLNAACLVY